MSSFDGEQLLVFLCLALVYGATTLFCLLRLIKIHRFSSEWKQTKVFYVLVLMQVLLRTVIFIILISKDHTPSESLLFFLISLPDSLFIIGYMLLVLQMLSVFYYTHDVNDQSQSFIPQRRRRRPKMKCSYMVIFFISIWVPMQAILYIMLFAGSLNASSITKEVGIVNLGVPFACFCVLIANYLRYSGVPPRSFIWKKKLRKINLVTMAWTGTRLIRGVFSMLAEYSSSAVSAALFRNADDLLTVAVWLFMLIFSEIICVLLVLDYSFIGIFLFSEEDDASTVNHHTASQARSQVFHEEEEEEEEEKATRPDSLIVENAFVTEADVTVLEPISEQKGKLGGIYHAQFQGREVAYRKIQFTRLSKYVMQEFSAEIEAYKQLSSLRMVRIYGIVLDLPTVGIIMPYCGPSLYHVLHVDNNKLTLKQAVSIGLELALTLQEIHFQRKVHGHLTSHNIFLTSSLKPLISDLGFHKVKKYAAIMFGYSTKTGWSSPEILKEKRLIPVKTLETDDIYSLGIVLWELLSGQEPFAGYSLKELEAKVVTEALRPKMPENLNPELERIVVSCLNADPNTRPAISLIISTLETFSKKL